MENLQIDDQKPTKHAKRRANTGRILVLLVVVSGFTLVSLVIVELVGGVAQLRNLVDNAGPWAPLVYLLLKASTYVIAPLSGTSLELASGALFGPWVGVALSLLGSTLGAVLNYWIARTWGRAGISKFAGKKALSQIDHATSHVATWRILLVARLVLSPVYDFISYAAGLTRISFSQFLLVTFVGGVLPNMLFPLIGNASVSSQFTNYIIIAVCGVLFVGLTIALVRHKRQRVPETKP